MCRYIDQLPRITCVILLEIVWCTGGTCARENQDGCMSKHYINETEICIKSCHETISIAVNLNLFLNSTQTKVILNNITAKTTVSSVLKAVTEDNIFWTVFMNEAMLSNESVPMEGYRFDGWNLRSSVVFKVWVGDCTSLTTPSATTDASTIAGGNISQDKFYNIAVTGNEQHAVRHLMFSTRL